MTLALPWLRLRADFVLPNLTSQGQTFGGLANQPLFAFELFGGPLLAIIWLSLLGLLVVRRRGLRSPQSNQAAWVLETGVSMAAGISICLVVGYSAAQLGAIPQPSLLAVAVVWLAYLGLLSQDRPVHKRPPSAPIDER